MRVISWSTCYDDPTYGSPLFVIQRRRRFHFDVIDARYDPRRLCCRIGTQGGRAYLHGERGSRKGLLTFKRRKNKKKKKRGVIGGVAIPSLPLPSRIDYNEYDEVVAAHAVYWPEGNSCLDR